MIYRTCRGCDADSATCERRKQIADGVKGLRITSVLFTCNHRQPKYRVGQRILFDTRIGGDWDGEEIRFAGTVIKESKPGRFIVRVDDGPAWGDEECEAPDCFENKSGYLAISYLNMRTHDGSDRRVCPLCDALVDFEDTCWAQGMIGMDDHKDCLRKVTS